MGWLTPKEQRRVKRKFGIQALYMCDYCDEPIGLRDIPVINTKRGYHKWPEGLPRDVRKLTAREPKVTYHNHPCNDYRLGKRPKEVQTEGENMGKDKKSKKSSKKSSSKSKGKKEVKVTSEVKSASKGVMTLVTKKPDHYNKRGLFRKLKDKFDKDVVRDAISVLWSKKELRKTDGKYHPVEAE